MKSRSVSITGATGFVGWHVAEAFREHGWEVRAIVRPGSRKPLPAGVRPIESGLDAPSLARAVQGSDALVHCAGLIRAPTDAAFAAVNVEGTRSAVAAANASAARFCLISSLAAGGTGTPARPRRETDPSQPVNAYGRSKVAAEAAVRAECRTPWTILRPCAVYGPRDRGFLPLFQFAKRGLFLLPTAAEMPFTLIEGRELARAVVSSVESERAAGETMFVGHPQPRTSADIQRAIAAAVGTTYRPRAVPRMVFRAVAMLGDLAWSVGAQLPVDRSRYAEFTAEGFVCSVERAREVMNFTATIGLEEGMSQTAAWYRSAGWL
jgi:dihydroflavonol-4-reductase